ncbi:bifunctional DNA-formamidopyrimidine glycosylase/DNA-(apurinic or apyrimidinic site) lyase [Planococcus halocryophilus]|uniref:bifunctional DNA-formamidopyrimidine glycosylase/DNA-(apurinic or apyrimidinic site) lyase n=1 Tax=Planococcus halocryophilus TaxID=1215089 RepID=UPI001F0EFF18|nr:bifunctional DNA-formamidopyrimidine glycosylase/DNA-(apurinic or apyrimidinic site) lyase [Planococcus halocryophilus]MCH4827868.1 bifunctional DNA-formamidopyrimidine glycosylase/DNA-(apurinic or apyrimidinic site) lyase [Planococcus halocryophilus]
MPELPEVEGVVRQIRPVSIGKKIEAVAVSDVIRLSKENGKEAIIKRIEADGFIERLTGAQIVQVERRSKYIYFTLRKDNEFLLVNHLGMSGAWFYVDQLQSIPEDKFRRHVHIVFTLSDGNLLAFSDIRRFGEMRVLQQEGDFPPLLLMAPEPFHEGALEHFLALAESPKYKNKAIKEIIMDGQIISGCGNIYATEALFKMKIHPKRAASRISRKRKVELFESIVAILQESIRAGGSTISDYRDINGESGSMQNRFGMYGKKQCADCGTETKTLKIGGRASVYCPTCQK